jgi:hypothetical protein
LADSDVTMVRTCNVTTFCQWQLLHVANEARYAFF